MYDFLRGPFVWVSFFVFFFGTLFQIIRFFALSRQREVSLPNLEPQPVQKSSDRFSLPTIQRRIALLRATTIIGMHPFMAGISLLFHVFLFVIPIFLLGHNVLLDQSWGFSLCSFSEKTTDILTITLLAFVVLFLFRRLFIARVRAISTFYDFVVLFLVAAPFVTGFLAYHQVYDYKTVLIIHILAGELMLMAIPFSKLVHMVFFFINRFLLRSEYSFSRGSRTW